MLQACSESRFHEQTGKRIGVGVEFEGILVLISCLLGTLLPVDQMCAHGCEFRSVCICLQYTFRHDDIRRGDGIRTYECVILQHRQLGERQRC